MSGTDVPCEQFNRTGLGKRKRDGKPSSSNNGGTPQAAAPDAQSNASPPKATAPPFILGPDNAELTFNSSFNKNIDIQLFSQTRQRHAWPGDAKVWTLRPSSQLVIPITCIPSELICWGASERLAEGNGYGISWGVGIFGRNSCQDCCFKCGTRLAALNFTGPKSQEQSLYTSHKGEQFSASCNGNGAVLKPLKGGRRLSLGNSCDAMTKGAGGSWCYDSKGFSVEFGKGKPNYYFVNQTLQCAIDDPALARCRC